MSPDSLALLRGAGVGGGAGVVRGGRDIGERVRAGDGSPDQSPDHHQQQHPD